MTIVITIASLVAVLLAIGLIAVFFIACRSFEVVFGITFALFCLEAVLLGLPIFTIGRNIQVLDPWAVIVFVAAVSRIVFGFTKDIGAPHWLQLSLMALMAVPLAIGFRVNGMAAAPDFRWFFHFLAFSLYASSFDFNRINFDRLVRYVWIAGAMIALLVFFRWAAQAAGLPIAKAWFRIGENRQFRVINAAQAYVLAQAALMLLIMNTAGGNKIDATPVKGISGFISRWAVVIAGLELATALALMHRSVWISCFAGIAALSAIAPAFRKQVFRMGGVSALLLMIAIVPLGAFGYLDSFFDSLAKSVSEVGEYHSSFADRYLGWEALLQDWWARGNILNYATGLPFGSGYGRRVAEFGSSYFVEYTPHNFYVQTLLRTGVIGLTLFCSLIAVTGIRLFHGVHSRNQNLDDTATKFKSFLLLAVVMQAVFMLAYGARLEQGIFFGMAMGYVAWQQRQGQRPALARSRHHGDRRRTYML